MQYPWHTGRPRAERGRRLSRFLFILLASLASFPGFFAPARAADPAAPTGRPYLAPARADSPIGPTGRPFLKRPAFTPAALDRQVEADPQLFARYEKHFDAAAPILRAALRRMEAVTLPPGRYTVWLTSRDGLRYPTAQDRLTPTPAFRIRLASGPAAGLPAGIAALAVGLAPESYLEAGSGNPIAPFRPAEHIEVVVEGRLPRTVMVDIPREVLVPATPAVASR